MKVVFDFNHACSCSSDLFLIPIMHVHAVLICLRIYILGYFLMWFRDGWGCNQHGIKGSKNLETF